MPLPVQGDSTSNTVPGVLGNNTSAARGDGVFGDSTTGRGVVGRSSSDVAEGVGGFNTQPTAPGGPGVLGVSIVGFGIHGHSSNQTGVVGDSTQGDGVFGNATTGRGVVGQSNSDVAEGVGGLNTKPTAPGGPGVLGVSVAGLGVHGHSTSLGGVVGDSDDGEGVHGETNSTSAAAVVGIMLNPGGTGPAVYGENRGLGPAGFFKGDAVVTGLMNVQGGVGPDQGGLKHFRIPVSVGPGGGFFQIDWLTPFRSANYTVVGSVEDLQINVGLQLQLVNLSLKTPSSVNVFIGNANSEAKNAVIHLIAMHD